jgi:hypothetical protein
MCGRDVIYIRIIYRTSGVSKVNFVYGKTRVKIDLRDRETRRACHIYRTGRIKVARILDPDCIYCIGSGTAKVNLVKGKTHVESEFT